MNDRLMKAILAMDSYSRGYGEKIAGLGGAGAKIGNARLEVQSNIAANSAEVKAGFYAASYSYNGEKVIAYRGTDNAADIWHGWVAGAGFSSSAQAMMSAQFYKTVLGAANPFVGSVSFVGHSLGGGLAGLMAGLYGQEAVIFDNMPFELAASNVYAASTGIVQDSAIKSNYYFNGATPQAINNSGITAYATTGEILSSIRGLQATPVNYLDSHAFFENPVNLHSQALLVTLIYAADNTTSEWSAIGRHLINALFDDDVAQAAGIFKTEKGITKASADQMLTKIAYSSVYATGDASVAGGAISSDELVFGDTAIRALFNDANELGKAVAARGVSSLLDGFLWSWDAQEAISKMLVQFAGKLAEDKVIYASNAEAAASVNGMLNLSGNALTLDFTSTYWDSADAVGKREMLNNLYSKFAIDDLSIMPDSAAIEHIILAAKDNGVSATINSLMNEDAVFFGGKGDDVIYGGDGDDIIIGGKGNDAYKMDGNSGNDTIIDTDGDLFFYNSLFYGQAIETFIGSDIYGINLSSTYYEITLFADYDIKINVAGNASDSVVIQNFINGAFNLDLITEYATANYLYKVKESQHASENAVEIIQKAAGVGSLADSIDNIPVPALNPKYIKFTTADGVTAAYKTSSGNVLTKISAAYGANAQIGSGDVVVKLDAAGNEVSYVKESANLRFVNESVDIALGAVTGMIEGRIERYSNFMQEQLSKQLFGSGKVDASMLPEATKQMLGQFIAGSLNGQSLLNSAADFSDVLIGSGGKNAVSGVLDQAKAAATGVLDTLDGFLNATLQGITGHDFSGASGEFTARIVAGSLKGEGFENIAKDYAIQYAKNINLDATYHDQITAAIGAATSGLENIDTLLNNTIGAVAAPILGADAFTGATTGLLQDAVQALKDGKDVATVAKLYGAGFGDGLLAKATEAFSGEITAVRNALLAKAGDIDSLLNNALGGLVKNNAFFTGISASFANDIVSGMLRGEKFEVIARDIAVEFAQSKGFKGLLKSKVTDGLKAVQGEVAAVDVFMDNTVGALISPIFGDDIFTGMSSAMLGNIIKTASEGGDIKQAVTDFAADFAAKTYSNSTLPGSITSVTEAVLDSLQTMDNLLNNTIGKLIPSGDNFFSGASGQFLGNIVVGVINGEDIGNLAKDVAIDYAATKGIELLRERVDVLANGAQDAFENIGNNISASLGSVTGAIPGAAVDFADEIITGLIEGRDIEEIAEEIALSLITRNLSGEVLGKALDGLVEGTSFGGNASFGIVKAAIIDFAAAAIMSKGKNLDQAVKNVVIQSAITKGMTEVLGREVLLNQATNTFVDFSAAAGANVTGLEVVKVPTPASAGASAAVISLAMSAMNGGINTNSVRDAAVAGATAFAASALVGTSTSAGLIGIQFGAAAGPVGMLIGAAIGVLITVLFKSGGEKVYHGETVGSVTQTLEDGSKIIVGIRETGALLQATIDAPDVYGTEADDILKGDNAENILNAGGGDDMLEGRGSKDVLLAGMGNDYVEAGAGDDYIDAGDGNDAVHGDEGNDIIIGGAGDDILSGGKGSDQIEGGAGDDLIYGDSGNDIILGGAGNDVITGGAGDDVISGDEGSDVIDGSTGNDEIHGDAGDDILFGDSGNDSLYGGSGADLIYGDAGIDILYGDLGDDILDGGADDDLLFGGLGNDILYGQDGDDAIFGELGDDYIVGGKGDDVLDGGEGADVYTMNRGDGKDVITDSGGVRDILRLANYTLAEITFLKNGDDLILRAAPNGDDQVTITNQLVDNAIEYLVLSDGTSVDLTTLNFAESGVASYSLVSNTARLNELVTQSTYAGTWQEAEQDRSYMGYNPYSGWYSNNYDANVISNAADMELYNDVQVRATFTKHRAWHGRTTMTWYYNDFIELNLVGTPGADRIVGFNVAETIDGLAGNDQLYGNSGADIIIGGADQDVIYGGSQDDTINGNDGNDKIYGGMGNDTINGDSGNDSIYGEWGADTIRGHDGDDFISGGTDNDTLYGDAGADILYGDAGSDNIRGGDGNDFVIGGDGADTLYGDAGDDYLEGGAGADYLDGGAGNDILRGEGEGDTLQGGDGDDLLIGGRGGDNINGGAGVDTASYAESDAGVVVTVNGAATGGYAAGDTLANIENIIGSDYNDILTGDAQNNILEGGYGNDKLYGGAGDDTLQGGAGADYLDGGAGYDSVSYADSNSGVEINLATGTGRFGYAQGDIYVGMEHVIGSKYDDRFIIGAANIGQNGNTPTITFEGGAGDDAVVMEGTVADYSITLDGSKYILVKKADNSTYNFADVEKIQFTGDNRTLTAADFPGNGDGVASLIAGNSARGVILPASSLATAGNSTSGVVTSLKTGTSHGSVTINTDGTYTYTPTSGYLGNDSFRVKLVDAATGFTRIESMTVTVNSASAAYKVIIPYVHNFPYSNYPVTSHVDVVKLQDDTYAVTWSKVQQNGSGNPDTNSLVLQKYDASFNAIGSEKVLIAPNTTGISAWFTKITELQNSNLFVTWTEAYSSASVSTNTFKPYAQILTKNGDPVSSVINLNPGGEDISYSSKVTSAELHNENVAVSWAEIDSTYLKIYSSNGAAISGKILLADNTSATQKFPTILQLNDSSFAAVWYEYNNLSMSFNLKLQRFYNNGNKIGSVQTITSADPTIYFNSSGAFGQYSIQALNNGNFVVFWASLVNNRTTYETHGQMFDSNFTPIGNLIIMQEFSGNKLNIVAAENGGFAVASIYNSGGVFLQSFNKNAVKTSDAVLIGEGGSAFISLVNLGNNNFEVSWNTSAGNIASKIIDMNFNYEGTTANDTLQANDKDNTIHALTGLDVVDSGAGDDIIYADDGGDIIDGGAGTDTLSYINATAGVTASLAGAANPDVAAAVAAGGNITNIENLIGSAFSDTLTGNGLANHIEGGAGADLINGAGGDDVLLGEGGNDTIDGGDGADNIDGGTGNDSITGGAGNDIITAGDGVDTVIYAGAAAGYSIVQNGSTITVSDLDASNGDDGIDTISGVEKLHFADHNFTLADFPHISDGVAQILSNTAASGILGDTKAGQSFAIKTATTHGRLAFNADGTYIYTPNADYIGSDSFSYIATNAAGLGKVINVTLQVGDNPVLLAAKTGNNIYVGGADNDVITGGSGSDVITTGLGADTIIISLNQNSRDIITDFDLASDKIDLSDYNFMLHNFGALKAHISQQAADTAIDFGNGQSLVLQNTLVNSLTQANFIGNASHNTDPTVNVAITDQHILAGNDFSISLAGSHFADADGDVLTYSLKQIVDADGVATAVAAPSWLALDPVTMAFSGTAPTDFLGMLHLALTADDSHGGTVTQNFDVLITNPITAENLASGLVMDSAHDVTITYTGGSAGYQSSLGYYRIREDGSIYDTHLVFTDQHAVTIGSEIALGALAAGDSLGFFIMANGNNQTFTNESDTIAASQIDFSHGTLQFVDSGNGSNLVYTDANGISYDYNGDIYHSVQNGMAHNTDDFNEHTHVTLDSNGQGIDVGFEDMHLGGDMDFNDVTFHVDLGIGGKSTGYDQLITGWGQNDTLTGSDGNDIIRGWHGDDVINGGAGNDTLYGLDPLYAATDWGKADGNDIIHGGDGNDFIEGDAGADQLFGDAGNDWIFGGLGADLLSGGLGDDVFCYENLNDSTASSHDTITDFTAGSDVIDLVALHTFGIESFADLTINQDVANNETIITANDAAINAHTGNAGAHTDFELHLDGIIDLHQTDFAWG